jgi:universal stress protein E
MPSRGIFIPFKIQTKPNAIAWELSMNYKHLLVGVDFSPCSADAVKEAIRLAAFTEARVSVVHVLDDEVMRYLKGQTVLDEARTRSEAQARLEDFVREHAGDYDRVETLLRVGHPFGELVTVCMETNPDLLLLGARGHGDDDSRVGVIASKCLRKAPLPVLLCQDRRGDPFKQIVCCVDYSPTGKRAIIQAIQVATLEKAALDFVHVFASPYTYQESGTGYFTSGLENSEDFAKIMKQNLRNYLTAFEEDLKGLEVTQTVVDRVSMGHGIIDRLCEVRGDLLVMGTRGRTGWKKLLLGTTAEHVIHRAPCSILAVKPADFEFSLD